jgi:hypothetical protein
MKKQLKENPLIFTFIGLGLFAITEQFEMPSDILEKILIISAVIIASIPVVLWLKSYISK